MERNLKKEKFSIENALQSKIIIGMFLILSLCIPIVVNPSVIPIYEYLYKSLATSDAGALILSSFMLIIMNLSRIILIYMAVLILHDHINIYIEEKTKKLLLVILSILIIPFEYYLVNMVYDIRYHFGMPSLISIVAILLLYFRKMEHITIFKKMLFIVFLLIGAQWLDLTPALTKFGFGYGEISTDIKNASMTIEADLIMNVLSLFLFVVFTLNSLMIYRILSDENKMFEAMDMKRALDREREEARINRIKIRSAEETQNLVHDLKSPLTIIEMYASLIKMQGVNKKQEKYVSKIDSAVDQLNQMISEILQEDRMRSTTVNELFDSVLSQLSIYDLDNILKVDISCPELVLCVNRTRISRAIVNVVKNGIDSIETDIPKIDIQVKVNVDHAEISITDNGKGIEENYIEKIFKRGFSTKESYGIGLEFVKNVIENHAGSIEMKSKLGVGTKVVIKIPIDC